MLVLKCRDCNTYYHIKNKKLPRKELRKLKDMPCPNCKGKRVCVAYEILQNIA